MIWFSSILCSLSYARRLALGFFPFGVGALAGFRPGSRGVGFLSFAPRLLGFGWVAEGFGVSSRGSFFVFSPSRGGACRVSARQPRKGPRRRPFPIPPRPWADGTTWALVAYSSLVPLLVVLVALMSRCWGDWLLCFDWNFGVALFLWGCFCLSDPEIKKNAVEVDSVFLVLTMWVGFRR